MTDINRRPQSIFTFVARYAPVFLRTQIVIGTGMVLLAIVPFAMIWFGGELVGHNQIFALGVALHFGIAFGHLVRATEKFLKSKSDYYKRYAGLMACFILPPALYLSGFVAENDWAVLASTEWKEIETSSFSLVEWVKFWLNSYCDIATFGLHSAFANVDAPMKLRTVSVTATLFCARLLFTLVVVSFFANEVSREYTKTGKNDAGESHFALMFSLGAIVLLSVVTVTAVSAGVSILPISLFFRACVLGFGVICASNSPLILLEILKARTWREQNVGGISDGKAV